MVQSHIKHKTFTLIEMLIVIVIIGILASALIPRLVSVQWRARDTRRKTDLRTIYNANEIYFLDNQVYPIIWTSYNNDNGVYSHTASWNTYLSGLVSNWIITSLPVDPINNGSSIFTGGYSYLYHGVRNTPVRSYDLVTQLENPNDPERCAIKLYKRSNTSWPNLSQWCPTYSSMIYDISPNVQGSVN